MNEKEPVSKQKKGTYTDVRGAADSEIGPKGEWLVYSTGGEERNLRRLVGTGGFYDGDSEDDPESRTSANVNDTRRKMYVRVHSQVKTVRIWMRSSIEGKIQLTERVMMLP